MNKLINNFTDIIDFWFGDVTPQQWWAVNPQFDNIICQRFGSIHQRAIAGELWNWRSSALGSLAEIIIIDQFSRNMYRGTRLAFAHDTMALVLAQAAIAQQFDQTLIPIMRGFMYLPFMHSESSIIHEEAVKLYSQKGLESNLDFELKHKEVIDLFGRYPHRNSILGRESTLRELEFLKTESGW